MAARCGGAEGGPDRLAGVARSYAQFSDSASTRSRPRPEGASGAGLRSSASATGRSRPPPGPGCRCGGVEPVRSSRPCLGVADGVGGQFAGDEDGVLDEAAEFPVGQGQVTWCRTAEMECARTRNLLMQVRPDMGPPRVWAGGSRSRNALDWRQSVRTHARRDPRNATLDSEKLQLLPGHLPGVCARWRADWSRRKRRVTCPQVGSPLCAVGASGARSGGSGGRAPRPGTRGGIGGMFDSKNQPDRVRCRQRPCRRRPDAAGPVRGGGPGGASAARDSWPVTPTSAAGGSTTRSRSRAWSAWGTTSRWRRTRPISEPGSRSTCLGSADA